MNIHHKRSLKRTGPIVPSSSLSIKPPPNFLTFPCKPQSAPSPMLSALQSPPATSTALGLPLLPCELLHEILFRLPLPDLHRLRSVSHHLSALVSSPDFRRLYHLNSSLSSSSWLFILSKRPPRESILRGFHSSSSLWCFRFPLLSLQPFDDPYFLAASGPFFLFASNSRRDLVSIHLPSGSIHRVPPSPLGPCGTSSWRRSALKLTADPNSHRFRFLFAEMYNSLPYLFEYRSDTATWHASEAVFASSGRRYDSDPLNVYLHLAHTGTESLVLCTGPRTNGPLLLRPRFTENPLGPDRLHVYGDGNMAIIKSVPMEEGSSRVRVRTRVLTGIELWGISSDGTEWVLKSRVCREMIEGIKKPYGVMMGCMAEREGVVRLVLMSNCRGAWDLVWLSYNRAQTQWRWIPVPDCGTKGLNMAGIALSSTFSRLWPAPAGEQCK
ncbi:hypothetical protein LUZ60_000722 [Juncus effusus]|nr:hypothetical protein LUZ60_000722 [Juncus effusus]